MVLIRMPLRTNFVAYMNMCLTYASILRYVEANKIILVTVEHKFADILSKE